MCHDHKMLVHTDVVFLMADLTEPEPATVSVENFGTTLHIATSNTNLCRQLAQDVVEIYASPRKSL